MQMETELSKAKSEAKLLNSMGYMIISRAHHIASRIDRENWVRYSINRRLPICGDWYRRCVSKDRILVTEIVRKYMNKSGDYRGKSYENRYIRINERAA